MTCLADLADLKEEVSNRSVRHNVLCEDKARYNKQLEDHKKTLFHIEEAKALIQKISADMNSVVAYSMSDIVQSMLDSLFPSRYKCVLDFTIKNNRTHVDIYLDMNGEKIYPLDQDGGGVANIMELGLRLASLQLGSTRKTIILDQPLKDLSGDFLPIGASILKKISEDLGLQLIIINHVPEFMEIANKTFHFEKDAVTGISEVKVVGRIKYKEK